MNQRPILHFLPPPPNPAFTLVAVVPHGSVMMPSFFWPPFLPAPAASHMVGAIFKCHVADPIAMAWGIAKASY